MQFYFIRHGQSENNLLWNTSKTTVGRSIDAGLSSTGREQATILADFLANQGVKEAFQGEDQQNLEGFHLNYLYTSLQIRAVATGSIVAKRLGLPLVTWTDIHEAGGIFREDPEKGERIGMPGNNREFFEKNYPLLVLTEYLGSEGWWNRSFENPEERLPRAKSVLVELLDRHGSTNDRVAFFSHGGFYNYFMKAIFSLNEDHPISFALNNVGITRVDFTNGKITIVYMNRMDFLPKSMITI